MSQSIESKVAAGKACKDKGNIAFSGTNYTEALRSYHEAILFLKGLDAGALQSIVPGQSLEKGIQEEIKTVSHLSKSM